MRKDDSKRDDIDLYTQKVESFHLLLIIIIIIIVVVVVITKVWKICQASHPTLPFFCAVQSTKLCPTVKSCIHVCMWGHSKTVVTKRKIFFFSLKCCDKKSYNTATNNTKKLSTSPLSCKRILINVFHSQNSRFSIYCFAVA